ncbi:MAG: ABC-2 type transporter [Candidatus Bathyarchaeia archaeon]|jgi:ABC-2 type transport system permease protein
MMEDVFTVIWKEYKEVFAHKGIRVIPLFVIPVLILGVFLPWQMGISWLNTPVAILLWSWLQALLVVNIVADSFAGERERHTLETLLASRLPDRAILFGKIGISVLYSWSMTLVGMAVALVTVNVLYGGSGLLMYSADTFLIGTTISALIALLVASGGVLVSLRAATVRQAQQIISLLFMIPWFTVMFGIQVVPEDWEANIMATLGGLNTVGMIGLVEVIIVVVDVGLITVAVSRFKRAKLSLD